MDIAVGLAGEHKTLVTVDLAVNFMGREDARVLGTPFLIMMLEMTARNSIKPYLGEGEDSVGTVVNIRHLAATPLGARVNFKSRVTEVEGKRVRFEIEAFDDTGKIAEGTHERFVINVERFARRVREKR